MLEPRRVLLVDDEAPMRQAISQWLSLGGFDVEAHDRSEPAIAQLSADYDGILVTDLKMEGIDGMALLGHVRNSTPICRW